MTGHYACVSLLLLQPELLSFLARRLCDWGCCCVESSWSIHSAQASVTSMHSWPPCPKASFASCHDHARWHGVHSPAICASFLPCERRHTHGRLCTSRAVRSHVRAGCTFPRARASLLMGQMPLMLPPRPPPSAASLWDMAW